MKTRLALLALLLSCLASFLHAQYTAGLFVEALSKTIDSAGHYDDRKRERIQSMIQNGSAAPDPFAQYNLAAQLYEEYKLYQFDSAFLYAQRLQTLAKAGNDEQKIADARLKLAFVLLSAGMYGEADEVLRLINTAAITDSLKADYYLIRGRYFYDLADYNGDKFFYPVYFKRAGDYLDSALRLLPANAFNRIYFQALKQIKTGDLTRAFDNFQTLLARPALTEHEKALVTSTLSYIYFRRGDVNTAAAYQAQAAMADIRSSTKETFAILNLSQLLFDQGDFANASRFIKKAIDDATTYGARQRKIQVNSIMPIIQSSELNYMARERRYWIVYAAVVSVVLILFVLLAVTIRRQNRKLAKAKAEISDAHQRLAYINEQLQAVNDRLQQVNTDLVRVNKKLEEANKIKEEYVGYFFTINAELFRKVERFKRTLEQKVHYGKLDEIRYVVNGINISQEKEELLKNFDRAFLKLFPHFVADFNALFADEDRYNLEDGSHLNTDLRIYALIRLGIRENEKIAEILEYSIKSIYAYKTKIRNKALVPKEEFERRVMEIPSV